MLSKHDHNIEDSVLAQSFGCITGPLKTIVNYQSCLFSCPNANCIPVAFEAIPVERDAGNLLLSGTVRTHMCTIHYYYIQLGLEV